MDVIWRRGAATVREVMDELNASGSRPRAYTTYMTTLARLDRKGLLVRRVRAGRTTTALRFRARSTPSSALARRSRRSSTSSATSP
jgi:predicted transcriptional regulator